jgi:hypothetical protein
MISTMCRMCGENKPLEGFNDEGECADCDKRIELRAMRRARIWKEALANMVKGEPPRTGFDGFEQYLCGYCDGGETHERGPIEHKDDCPWLAAEKLVKAQS